MRKKFKLCTQNTHTLAHTFIFINYTHVNSKKLRQVFRAYSSTLYDVMCVHSLAVLSSKACIGEKQYDNIRYSFS